MFGPELGHNSAMGHKRIWGLTGGIGSGKSTVAGLLATHGLSIIDADAIARALTLADGLAIPAIRQAFGDAFISPTGEMDRGRMRDWVFANPVEKKRLEAILHPLIHTHTEAAIADAPSEVVVCDVPLLVESPRWRQRVHLVWVVDCAQETQIERVVRRSGLRREAIEAIIQQQASRAMRLVAADIVVFNDGMSQDVLAQQVTHCLQHLGI